MTKAITLKLSFKPHSRYHLLLRVFPTKKKMQLFRRAAEFDREFKSFEACCCYVEKGYKVAEVWCYKGSANPASLAHEFVHASLAYLQRIKKDDLRPTINDALPYDERPEEILCYAVQELLDRALVRLEGVME